MHRDFWTIDPETLPLIWGYWAWMFFATIHAIANMNIQGFHEDLWQKVHSHCFKIFSFFHKKNANVNNVSVCIDDYIKNYHGQ